jgi:putative endonuclease
LYSEKYEKIYIGYSSNLIERIKDHNFRSTKGHTTRFRPWVVIYVETFKSKNEAMLREKRLKGGQGRAWIWAQINNSFNAQGFISA